MRLGVFDSGFGGLTIQRAIRARLPQYDCVYLGDNARTPYGHRSFEAVYRFTAEAVRFLLERDCALVVVACNTASARALRTVQQKLLPVLAPDRRVLGIIRPSVEALAREPGWRTVALWATPGTVASDSYGLELAKLRPQLRLVQVACPLLVPLVENGELDGGGLDHFVRRYWAETEARAAGASVDALLLACTHYPLVLPRIRAVVPAAVTLLSQSEIVAPSLEDYLRRHPEIEMRLERGGATTFLTTDTSEAFDRLGELFLGHPVQSERVELAADT
ncbi:MAG TPA: glutamate racemase [Vicinamibacteria bacterium]|nr:glutamate racemase [Vicinamibacteria bacterium]